MNTKPILRQLVNFSGLIMACAGGFTAYAQIPSVLLAPKESLSWPPVVERIAEELYKNKVAAMAVHSMRLREFDEKTGKNDYVRGKAFLQGIQELGAAADDKL